MVPTHFILGLDVSTSCTGWCALPLESNNITTLGGHGKIITEWRGDPKSPQLAEDFFQRVDWLIEELDKIVLQYNFAACGMEQLNSFRGGETSRQLAGIQKIIQYHLLKKHKIQVNEIHTTTIKKVFGSGLWEKGMGSPKKPDMVRFANDRFGLNLKFVGQRRRSIKGVSFELHLTDDDVADGIGVAYALREEVGVDLIRQLAR